MANIGIKQATGFLITGAVVGAAIALLYAPQSGARTSRDIRKFARKSANRINHLQGDVRDQVSDWVEDFSEVIKAGVTQGYDQVLQGFDNAKKCVEDGKHRVEQLIKSA